MHPKTKSSGDSTMVANSVMHMAWNSQLVSSSSNNTILRFRFIVPSQDSDSVPVSSKTKPTCMFDIFRASISLTIKYEVVRQVSSNGYIQRIVLLQEIHSFHTDKQNAAKEWNGDISFAHGEYNARGVAIFITQYLIADITKTNQIVDTYGRYIFFTCTIFETKITLISWYGPTKDQIKGQ